MSADQDYAAVVAALSLSREGKVPDAIRERAMAAAGSLFRRSSATVIDVGDESPRQTTVEQSTDEQGGARERATADVAQTLQTLFRELMR